MAYFTLLLGLAITLYTVVALYRRIPAPVRGLEAENPEKRKGLAPTFSPLAAPPPGSTLVFELKEKVEEHLVELGKQKELLTQLALRIERKLEAMESRKFRSDPVPTTAGEDDRPAGAIPLEEDSLERLRLYNDVYLMYDHGVPIAEIARQVERGKGEVELILGLRK